MAPTFSCTYSHFRFIKTGLIEKPRIYPKMHTSKRHQLCRKYEKEKACVGKKLAFSMTQNQVIFAASYKNCPACHHCSPSIWPAPPAEPHDKSSVPFDSDWSLTISASRHHTNIFHRLRKVNSFSFPFSVCLWRYLASSIHPREFWLYHVVFIASVISLP